MCRGCRKVVKSGWQVVRPWTLNYDARSTTHQINFGIVPPSSPKSSKWNLSLRFPSPKLCLYLSCPPYVPCAPPDPFSFSLDHPDNIFLSTLFSDTLSFSFDMRHQVWHPYKTTDKIIVLYILIFTVFDNRLEHKRFCTEW